MLERESPQIETFERELKGFTQAFSFTRLWVTGEGADKTGGAEAAASVTPARTLLR